MVASKKKTFKKEIKKAEDIEEKAAHFGLKSFLIISGIVIISGCLVAYSLRDIPQRKRPSVSKENTNVMVQEEKFNQSENESREQIEHLEETVSMLRKALSKQVDEVEHLKQITSERNKETTLSVQLLGAIYAGKPFAMQVENLKAFNPNSSLLNEISPLMSEASSGIPSFEKVSKSFFEALPLAEQSFYIDRKDSHWKNKTILFLKGLVRIRPQRIDEENPTGILQLYQAEDFMNQGDIEKALQAVQNLPPSAKTMMNSFIKGASSYLKLKKCFK